MSKTVQIDARREEFRKYLEKEGILVSLTKVLVALYEEPDKPSDALSFAKNNFASNELQAMRIQVDNLIKENEQLKTKINTLEMDKAGLEKKIVDMEEKASVNDKKDENENFVPSKPIGKFLQCPKVRSNKFSNPNN